MPNTLEVIVYMLAFIAGAPAFHSFARWYSKSFRWLMSSVIIQAAYFVYWLAQHPQ